MLLFKCNDEYKLFSVNTILVNTEMVKDSGRTKCMYHMVVTDSQTMHRKIRWFNTDVDG